MVERVFAVYDGSGNMGNGRLLGVFRTRDDAEMEAKGRGDRDDGRRDALVLEVPAVETPHGWHIVQNEIPLRIGDVEPRQPKNHDVVLAHCGPNRLEVMKFLHDNGYTYDQAKSAVNTPNFVVGQGSRAKEMMEELALLGAVVNLVPSEE